MPGSVWMHRCSRRYDDSASDAERGLYEFPLLPWDEVTISMSHSGEQRQAVVCGGSKKFGFCDAGGPCCVTQLKVPAAE
jgi:hypothetical protein